MWLYLSVLHPSDRPVAVGVRPGSVVVGVRPGSDIVQE